MFKRIRRLIQIGLVLMRCRKGVDNEIIELELDILQLNITVDALISIEVDVPAGLISGNSARPMNVRQIKKALQALAVVKRKEINALKGS